MDTRQIIIATAIIFLTTAATSYTIDGGETEDIDTDWDETVTFDLEGTWVFNDGAPDTSGPSLFFGSEVQREEYGEETVRSPWPDREIAEETINITYVPQSDAEDNWPGNQEDVSSIEFEMLNGWEIKSRTDGQDEYTNDHVVLPPHPTADQWEYRCGNSHEDIQDLNTNNLRGVHDCPEDYGLPANRYNYDSGDTFEHNQQGPNYFSQETISETIGSVEAGPDGDKNTASFEYDPELRVIDPYTHISGTGTISSNVEEATHDIAGDTSSSSHTYEFTSMGFWANGPDFFMPNNREIWMAYPRVDQTRDILEQDTDYISSTTTEDVYTDEESSSNSDWSCEGDNCDGTVHESYECTSPSSNDYVDWRMSEETTTVRIDPEIESQELNPRDSDGSESSKGDGEPMTRIEDTLIEHLNLSPSADIDYEIEDHGDRYLEIEVTYQEAEYNDVSLDTSCSYSTVVTSVSCGTNCSKTGSGDDWYETEESDERNDDFSTETLSISYEDMHIVEEPVFTLDPNSNPESGGSSGYIHDPSSNSDDRRANYRPPQTRSEHTSVREGLFNNEPFKDNWDGPYEGFNVIEDENPSTYTGESDDGSSSSGTIPYNRIDGETWFSYHVDSPDELLGNSPSVSLSRFSLDIDGDDLTGDPDDNEFVSVREEQTTYNIDGENAFANGYIAMRHEIENEGTAFESRDDDNWNIVGSSPHFVSEELEASDESSFVTEADVEAYMSNVQCPDDKLTCVAAVDLYLDDIDDWDETFPTNTGSSIEMDYQVHHTSESLGVCEMFNELSDEEYDYDDSDRTQCVDDLTDSSGSSSTGPGDDGACDEAGVNAHGMMGPEVDESRFYDEDDNVVNSDFEACVEHSQCVYHGDPVDEGTVRDVSRLPHYDGYEMGQDSPDFEVCLNMDSDRLDDDWDEYIYDPALEEFDEGPSWGGQWYDLDDPAVNDYLRDETPSPQDDEGIRSELVTEDKQEEHEENENHIAYYWRENINPYHSEWNPEGTELEEIHTSSPDYSEGITLEVNCGHLIFNFGDDLECEGSVNSIEHDTNRIYSFYQFAGDISE